MRISIFGLGYVGSVSLGCFAQSGHSVVGVDVSEAKVALINEGKSPIVERGLDRIIGEQKARAAIEATADPGSAVVATDVSFICVGTPATKKGHLNLDGISAVAREIAVGIRRKSGFHVVVIRSTVLPGTNQKVGEIIGQASGKAQGRDFVVVSNPEFLREGTAVHDFLHPPYTLVGTSDERAMTVMREVYARIEAPIIQTDVRIAELIKYVNNAFHALKICYANEIGSVCKALEIDSHKLMDVFCLDTKLNISASYLKPGFAYGGSCLPKDLSALCAIAHDNYLKSPVLESIGPSNETHKARVLDRIVDFGRQKIGFLGLSFKEGTDDLRSSPIVDVLEKLLGKGYDLLIYDKNVSLAKLVGGNKDYIMRRIPFISRFLTDDIDKVIAHAELVVVVNNEPAFKDVLGRLPKGKVVYDLVNIDFEGRKDYKDYYGVAW